WRSDETDHHRFRRCISSPRLGSTWLLSGSSSTRTRALGTVRRGPLPRDAASFGTSATPAA
ncbi:MAG: hypothetical protein AVDCRST_MAG19-4925, partial [uncultured Thermomicrobiales bacterium]